MIIKDMPKLQSPFIRKEIDGQNVVTPEIDPECAWFLEEGVTCQEKLDGTNVSIVVVDGQITQVYNRDTRIPFFNKGKQHIIQGILESYGRGYCNFTDGQYFGELIGEKVQGNPYKIKGHIWLPFGSYCAERLTYKTWGKYPKDFDTISAWFKDGLISLYGMHQHEGDQTGFVEGVVFHHPDGRMCKLRRDMFDWYEGKRH